MLRAGALLGAVLCSSSAGAWPPDMFHDVEPGKEIFVPLTQVDWVEVDEPKLLSAEVLPGGEVLLTGHKPGRALVLLYAEGTCAVWRVRVGTPRLSPLPALEVAQKACGDALAHAPAEDTKLSGTVGDEKCRQAVLKLLEGDGFRGRELDLTIAMPVLQSQLAAMQGALRKAVKAKTELRYSGAGLILEGGGTEAEHRKVLWELFRNSVGRMALEDRFERPEPTQSDAGP
jgi:hypothetical protein